MTNTNLEKCRELCSAVYLHMSKNKQNETTLICSYVWQHLDIGYVQGMCDLLAPLLVILDDGSLNFSSSILLLVPVWYGWSGTVKMCVYVCLCSSEVMAFSCFTELMKRMNQNFPHGGAMDSHFANMRSLIQVKFTKANWFVVLCLCLCILMRSFVIPSTDSGLWALWVDATERRLHALLLLLSLVPAGL